MSESNSEEAPKQPHIPQADEAKKVTPFRIIRRGEDTIDRDDDIVFADFSPKVLPADAPDEVVAPKDESVLAPAALKGSTPKGEQNS